jgi:hypothetical protein
MALRRMSIKLLAHERLLLIEQFLRWRIPIDQFENRPNELREFTSEWNSSSKRNDAGYELVHYMRTQRKRGLWVKLEDGYAAPPPLPELTAEETEILVGIFNDNVTILESGSDILAYEDDVAQMVAKDFMIHAGRFVPAHQLVAKLTALRKRGLLPKVGERSKPEGRGFTDIDQAVI